MIDIQGFYKILVHSYYNSITFHYFHITLQYSMHIFCPFSMRLSQNTRLHTYLPQDKTHICNSVHIHTSKSNFKYLFSSINIKHILTI